MPKLDEIEAYFNTSVNRAREPALQGKYEDWLIQRVRKLETALEFYGHRQNWWHQWPMSSSSVIADGGVRAREALKED